MKHADSCDCVSFPKSARGKRCEEAADMAVAEERARAAGFCEELVPHVAEVFARSERFRRAAVVLPWGYP